MRSSQHYIAMSLYLRRARIIINNGIVNIGRTIGKPITAINGCTATGVVGNRIVIKIGYFNINGLTVGITARYGITGTSILDFIESSLALYVPSIKVMLFFNSITSIRFLVNSN